MYELPSLFISMSSNGKPIDAGLIIQKSLITKKLGIEHKDLLFMIFEL